MIYDTPFFGYTIPMDNMFREIIPLNDTEKELKKQYQNPVGQESTEHLLGKVFTNYPPEQIGRYIPEQALIKDSMDCAFVRHMRYLPPYWHKHEFFEVMYVLHGSCTNVYHSHSIPMKAGNICISAPSSVHTVEAFSDDAILLNILIRKSTFEHTFLALMEEDEILSTFFKRALYQVDEIPYLLFPIEPDEELLCIMEKTYLEFCENHRFQKHLLNSYLSNFFILLLRKHEHQLSVPAFSNNKHSEDLIFMLRYLQEHVETVTLQDMASFFNYSERQLQRIIEKATGMSFRENIQRQRLKKACELLENSQLSIEEIGARSGYPSPNNFRRIFENHYHMTPKEYRNKKRMH